MIETEIHQFELSRKSLLSNPAQGGLIESGETAAHYLASAGNDYRFASPQFVRRGRAYPVQVSLLQRCAACHGRGAMGIFTLSHHFLRATAEVVPALENVHGWDVAARKLEREDLKAVLSQR